MFGESTFAYQAFNGNLVGLVFHIPSQSYLIVVVMCQCVNVLMLMLSSVNVSNCRAFWKDYFFRMKI